jgi:plastocyanin
MARYGARLIDRMARLGIGLVSMALVAQGAGPVAVAQDEAPAAPPSIAASIVDFNFQPAELTVAVGDTVVWTNNGSAPHTATSEAGVWDTGTLSSGQVGSFTFMSAGTFQYRCNIHTAMRGTIVVN